MSDSIKCLAQLSAAATTTETLYTVPDVTQTTVSSIVVCNRTGGALSYRISVHVAGAGADDKQYIRYDKSVAANSNEDIKIGMTLDEGDVLKTYVSATGMSFNVFGVETS